MGALMWWCTFVQRLKVSPALLQPPLTLSLTPLPQPLLKSYDPSLLVRNFYWFQIFHGHLEFTK